MYRLQFLLLANMFGSVVTDNVFPYQKFLGLPTKLPTKVEMQFVENYFCKSNSSDPYCSCSSDCMKFRSCCMDYLWDATSNEDMDNYIYRFSNEASKHPLLECKAVSIGLPADYTTEEILMRSSCPKGTDGKMKKACTTENHPISVQPVLGNDGLIYKNSHCASCNNIGQYQRLELEAVDCFVLLSINSTQFKDKNKGCFIQLKKVSDKVETKSIRRCSTKVHDEKSIPPFIPIIQSKDYKLCQSYSSGIYYSGKNAFECFKNIHCMQLFLGEKFSSIPILQGCTVAKPTARNFNNVDSNQFTFSSVFSVSKLVSFEDLYPKSKCGAGEVYDDSTKTCIAYAVCGARYRMVGDKCVKIKSNINTPTKFLSSSKIQLSQAEILDICLSSRVNLLIYNNTITLPFYRLGSSKITVLSNTSSGLLVSLPKYKEDNITDYLTSIGTIKFDTIYSTIAKPYITELYGLDLRRTFPSGKLCANFVTYTNIKYTLSSNCWLFIENRTRLSPSEFILNIYNQHGRQRTTEIVKCNKYHLDSDCLKRTISNFTLHKNGALEDQSNNIVFDNAEDYTPLTKGIGVCITKPKTEQSQHWQRVTDGVENYVTIIGCFMSVFCYIWVMLTYTIIPALKTIPGKNIVCLCSMLMPTDVVLLISMIDVSFKACATFGVFLHFFALSAQFWAGIVAFDIWSTFRGRGRMMNRKSNKRFHIYLVLGYMVPAAVILVCMILELTNTVTIGYGLNGVCWIAVFMPRLLAYILPMVLITLFNITVLLYTITSIFKHNKKSKKLLKKSGGQDISLARMTLKLVILLGAVEILGLIQIPNASNNDELVLNSVFRLIFSIARAFRGVIIWLLYIVSDRVFNVYKDIRSQRSLRTVSRSTFVSSRTRSTYQSEDTTSGQDGQKLMQAVSV